MTDLRDDLRFHPPRLEQHGRITVVRDDLFPGGTKARYMGAVFAQGVQEAVYASPAEGGAQTSLALVARELGRRAVIFTARRRKPHPRTLEAQRLGARIELVSPGYMSVCRARAADYVLAHRDAVMVPFGGAIPGATAAIADAARLTGVTPDEVWCAGGSGLLAQGLRLAWPDADLCVVQVGHHLEPEDVGGATIYRYPRAFSTSAPMLPPFPSDPHYDAKAWEFAATYANRGKAPSRRVVFWNVAGPAARA